MGHTLKLLVVVDLKFKFKCLCYILSGNPTQGKSESPGLAETAALGTIPGPPRICAGTWAGHHKQSMPDKSKTTKRRNKKGQQMTLKYY